ncbi:hypothetical protein BH753_gp004 [Bacillus phage Shbh1]|uniref:Uncharacterized protein n=1 Tax=Bacillus phage Shbh1 TaxID=1796992 RepID=A0A142F129_9CAUD|nr:hypothetical protein BH753_gp004 [Bacillus phage Shbh1]AMQ66486.1 hypothetical protein [Bacillus phage Shbh1]
MIRVAVTGKEYRLENKGVVAVAKVDSSGRVVVDREGTETRFEEGKTLEQVLNKFEQEGWRVIETTYTVKDSDVIIPKNMQTEVDEYLDLHREISALKAKMENSKKKIRRYMESRNLQAISGSKGGEVYLQECKASNTTTLFSDYELTDVEPHLTKTQLKKVVEPRVNAEKLEGLMKLGELSVDVVAALKEVKVCNPGTPQFRVRR